MYNICLWTVVEYHVHKNSVNESMHLLIWPQWHKSQTGRKISLLYLWLSALKTAELQQGFRNNMLIYHPVICVRAVCPLSLSGRRFFERKWILWFDLESAVLVHILFFRVWASVKSLCVSVREIKTTHTHNQHLKPEICSVIGPSEVCTLFERR